uniref:GDSL esterase/lipase n=1 Tax=Oryza punctata TaxID=4537 RepID=A0A0E0K3E5_ORYPU
MAGQMLPVIALVAVAVFAMAAAAAAKVPAMYVFGDSTADVGNNNYLAGAAVPRANFPHNGIDFPTSRPTGRFSNGYNGVDFLGTYRFAARLSCAVLVGGKGDGCEATTPQAS